MAFILFCAKYDYGDYQLMKTYIHIFACTVLCFNRRIFFHTHKKSMISKLFASFIYLQVSFLICWALYKALCLIQSAQIQVAWL